MRRTTLEKIKNWIFYLTIFFTLGNLLAIFFLKDYIHMDKAIFRQGQFICMLIVLALPKILKKRLDISVPFELYALITLFSFCALVLGDAFNFYGKFGWWDSMLHFQSGIILSFVGLWIIHVVMGRYSNYVYLNKAFLSIFIVFFSIGAGAIWEIGEYMSDDLFHTNAQQYMETTKGTMVSKQDIPLKGHAALYDTTKDLVLDLTGAVIVAVYGYIRHDKILEFSRNIKNVE